MRDLMRPKRSNSRSRRERRGFRSEKPHKGLILDYRKQKKRGWFWRWTFRLLIFICLISALPMIALRYIDPPTSSFIELNKRNHNTNIKHQ